VKPNRLIGCIIVVVRSGYRGARCVRAVMKAPRTQRALQRLVQLIAGDGEDAGVLSISVVVAAASAGALTLAAACAGPGAAELLKLAGAVSVGAVAISAAIVLVRRRSGPSHGLTLRGLVVRTLARLGAPYDQVPVARVLHWACEPSPLPALVDAARPAFGYVTAAARSGLMLYPTRRMLPVLGQALDVLEACKTSLDSARFVRHFALTALHVSAEARGLGGAPAKLLLCA
jgi:hypothetical protein